MEVQVFLTLIINPNMLLKEEVAGVGDVDRKFDDN